MSKIFEEHCHGWEVNARKVFEKDKFKASFRQYGNIQVLDWRSENGTKMYSMRVVIDPDSDAAYVSGDLGYGIIHSDNMSFKSLADMTYEELMKRTVASSFDTWTYNKDYAREEIKSQGIGDEKLIDWMLCSWTGAFFNFSDNLVDELANIGKSDIVWDRIGRLPHRRLVIWRTAFRMAYTQVYDDTVDEK